jgi:opacity protein-like surface antigen
MFKPFMVLAVSTLLIAVSSMARAADTAIVIVSHEVADFAAWKKGFDAGKANRDKAGMTERYVMRDLDKPNFVIVVLEADKDKAREFVSDPAFKERIKKASASGTADIRIGVKDPK